MKQNESQRQKRYGETRHAVLGLCVGLLVLTAPIAGAAPSAGDFQYATHGNAITLTHYTGQSGTVAVPANIQGLLVVRIGARAFQNCRSLTRVTIPDGVQDIGKSAFWKCTNLTSVSIGKGVTNIDAWAFYGCSKLRRVHFGPNVAQIGDNAFQECASLTHVRLPHRLKRIGDSSFMLCNSLTNVTIPDGLRTIGSFGFWDCANLTHVTFPASVTNIDYAAFNSCSSLKALYFKGDAPHLGQYVLGGATHATLYYRPGTHGWKSHMAGRPTAVWKSR